MMRISTASWDPVPDDPECRFTSHPYYLPVWANDFRFTPDMSGRVTNDAAVVYSKLYALHPDHMEPLALPFARVGD